jgi:hypothetical protein
MPAIRWKSGVLMNKVSIICLLVVGIILISGCIGEEKSKSKRSNRSESSKETSASPPISIPSPPDNNSSAIVPEISQPELMPGEFDINITSYYFVYLRDNLVMNENNTTQIPTFDLVEKNYVIYNLSIRNDDTNTLNFSINKLQLHTGNQVFTPAYPDTILKYPDNWVHVRLEIEKENRLNDTQMLHNQTLRGIVIFQVDNYTTLFDRSFSLRYNTTPIPSTSFEKSLEALTVAEQFDYSIAFDRPPYDIHRGGGYSNVLYTDPGDFYVWANWVNRTVFESYKKYDEMSLPKQKTENIPYVEIAYAVKVILEQDPTIFQNTSVPYYSSIGEKRTRTQLDMDPGDDTGLAILDNQTYMLFSGNMPQMFIPQATIVHFSFYSIYGWGTAMRLTFNNQDIILDEQHNITLARYDNDKVVS